MSDDIRPISPIERRLDQRRERDRRASGRAVAVVKGEGPTDAKAGAFGDETSGRPAGPAAPTARAGPQADIGAAAFAAQLMGQPGQKRGLKGGAEVLDAARSAYLGTEYSGRRDRRPKAGEVDDSEV